MFYINQNNDLATVENKVGDYTLYKEEIFYNTTKVYGISNWVTSYCIIFVQIHTYGGIYSVYNTSGSNQKYVAAIVPCQYCNVFINSSNQIGITNSNTSVQLRTFAIYE